MKSAWIVVVVCVMLTSAVFAQAMSPRAMGMGNAAVGVADDGAAWLQNPAGLGALSTKCEAGKTWANDVIGAWTRVNSDSDAWGITWSGWEPAKAMGFGAGYVNMQDIGKAYGAGFGIGLKTLPLSLGLNVKRNDPDEEDATTMWDAAALYQFVQPAKAPIRVGLVARDITDEVQTMWDLGVAWPATPKLLVAVDVRDLTDEVSTRFNAGVECKFGQKNEWTGRIGEYDNGSDNNLTLGAGYAFTNNWRLDAAWQNIKDGDDVWSVGAGFGF